MLPQAFLLLTLLRLGLATAQDVDLGCFKNITDGHRVLVANTMSISFCRVHCKNEHGPHMAQGYDDRVYHIYSVAKETCSCLEELPDRDLKVETSRCDVPCAGDDFELCGGTEVSTVHVDVEKVDIASGDVNSDDSDSDSDSDLEDEGGVFTLHPEKIRIQNVVSSVMAAPTPTQTTPTSPEVLNTMATEVVVADNPSDSELPAKTSEETRPSTAVDVEETMNAESGAGRNGVGFAMLAGAVGLAIM